LPNRFDSARFARVDSVPMGNEAPDAKKKMMNGPGSEDGCPMFAPQSTWYTAGHTGLLNRVGRQVTQIDQQRCEYLACAL
jgi:hypothetical protein